jgi:chemotaxis protein methyltransferase CheR
MLSITDKEFAQFQRFIYDAAGITLSPAKKSLVCGRLMKRVHQFKLRSYGDYFSLLMSGTQPGEAQHAIDLLTTNETYFFREPKHFDFLKHQAIEARNSRRAPVFRVWSAACSSGEEAYSIAMVLEDCLGAGHWEVTGSDICMRMLERARAGHYVDERISHIPASYLKRFCLKGTGNQQGTLLVERDLRSRMQFMQINLNASLPQMGMFDMIFLRNAMIYFNLDTKRQVVARVLALLKPGGHFVIGHSENLNGVCNVLETVAPSIYRKP